MDHSDDDNDNNDIQYDDTDEKTMVKNLNYLAIILLETGFTLLLICITIVMIVMGNYRIPFFAVFILLFIIIMTSYEYEDFRQSNLYDIYFLWIFWIVTNFEFHILLFDNIDVSSDPITLQIINILCGILISIPTVCVIEYKKPAIIYDGIGLFIMLALTMLSCSVPYRYTNAFHGLGSSMMRITMASIIFMLSRSISMLEIYTNSVGVRDIKDVNKDKVRMMIRIHYCLFVNQWIMIPMFVFHVIYHLVHLIGLLQITIPISKIINMKDVIIQTDRTTKKTDNVNKKSDRKHSVRQQQKIESDNEEDEIMQEPDDTVTSLYYPTNTTYDTSTYHKYKTNIDSGREQYNNIASDVTYIKQKKRRPKHDTHTDEKIKLAYDQQTNR